MSKLQEIKDQFESKTANGSSVEILAYKPNQDNAIVGIVFLNQEWCAYTWSLGGHVSVHPFGAGIALVPKKKHLPKDILCEVWGGESYTQKNTVRRYSNGEGSFYTDGANSLSTKHGTDHRWDNYKVLEQEPKPWYNDAECPIPEGLKYRVSVGGDWYSSDAGWKWRTNYNKELPITAYQILGEE